MRASRIGLGVSGAFALGALPGAVVLLVDWLPGSPLVGLGLLVPGAVVVGGERLSRRTSGPEIHDRQLDRIVATLVAVAALALVAAGLAAGGTTARSTLVLSTPVLTVGLIALLHGTRRLWQQRAAPLLLLAAWPVPWEAALAPVADHVGREPLTVGVTVLVLAVLVTLVVVARRRPGVGPARVPSARTAAEVIESVTLAASTARPTRRERAEAAA